VSPKRRDRAAPPPIGDEYDIRFANTEAAADWEHPSRHAAGNPRRAFEKIRAAPRALDNPDRQHQLKVPVRFRYGGQGPVSRLRAGAGPVYVRYVCQSQTSGVPRPESFPPAVPWASALASMMNADVSSSKSNGAGTRTGRPKGTLVRDR